MYFVNYYKSKNHKQRYKTKKLLYKVIVKYWKETTKNSLGIKDVLFDCTNLAPSPHTIIQASALLAGPSLPFPFEHTYFIDDPLRWDFMRY